MKRISTWPIVLLLLLGALTALAEPPAHVPRRPHVVGDLDLAQVCSGIWHEIARIPRKFQSDCACCVTARYTLREDGMIVVESRCTTADGGLKTFEAEAEVVDERTHARWKLAPFKILGLRPVKADMWIIGLGEAYDWMVIGNPDRDKGWIMAREPELAPGLREEIDALLERQGYDLSLFVETLIEGAFDVSSE